MILGSMRSLDSFRRDETGSATIEFVLWVPIIVAVLTIVIDATTVYITHSEMWNVARDTARQIVSGTITSEAQAIQHVDESTRLRDFTYYVDANYDGTGPVEVIVRLPLENISILGYGSPLTLVIGTLTARVEMRADERVCPFTNPPPGSDCP